MFICFRTEELRLATGASAPVARKKKVCIGVYISFILVLYRCLKGFKEGIVKGLIPGLDTLTPTCTLFGDYIVSNKGI